MVKKYKNLQHETKTGINAITNFMLLVMSGVIIYFIENKTDTVNPAVQVESRVERDERIKREVRIETKIELIEKKTEKDFAELKAGVKENKKMLRDIERFIDRQRPRSLRAKKPNAGG